MAFVQFSQVSFAFGDRDILKNVTINLQSGSKAALTGANGAGKSTFIKILAGLIKPDSGNRAVQKDSRIAYLPQNGLMHTGCTLKEEADKAFGFGYEMQHRIDKIGEELAKGNGNTDALVMQQSELIQTLEDSGWYRREVAAESVLLGIGFSRSDFDRKTEEFSGGWQMRIALAKVLMQNPDILLLDEPTNYLDIEARSWLEQFLQNYKGGFLLVSHDRYFLDVTINEVYELFNGELKRYPGNFSHYEKVREVELKTLIAEYEQQQQEISKLEDFITRFGYKATKAAQAQEYQKRLDKMVMIEIPESLKKIHFNFPPAPHSGRLVLRMKDICKSYDGNKNVIDNLELTLENGQRLVVVGRNGVGKSTLLRIVAGEDKNFSGEIIPGAGVQIGYFSQDSAETIRGNENILQYIESRAPLDLIPKIRDMLGAFLFRGDDVYKSLDMLSGGEKSRIALLQLLLSPVNLLVLDEPTNHLDIHSKDVLLNALRDFGGTVVFVSHDRGFIEQLATQVLELKPGEFKTFPGNYEFYQEQIAKQECSGQNDSVSAAKKSAIAIDSPKSHTKLSWEEQKKRDSERRKIEREIEKLEKEIDSLEGQRAELEAKLAEPEVYSSNEKAKVVQHKISELSSKIEELTAVWEEASEKLE